MLLFFSSCCSNFYFYTRLSLQRLVLLFPDFFESPSPPHFSSAGNRELLGEMEGIDVLLQQLSVRRPTSVAPVWLWTPLVLPSAPMFEPVCPPQVFKRHNPSTAEEQEMMENLFDALCSCLMLPANRERFLKGEGLQLMNLMLRWGTSWGEIETEPRRVGAIHTVVKMSMFKVRNSGSSVLIRTEKTLTVAII